MGEREVLVDIVEKARANLQKAQDSADTTKRPENACIAHDCQFALTKALTHGIDTLLMLKLEEMRDAEEEPDVLPTRERFGAMLAAALVQNMRTLIVVAGAVVTLLGLSVIFTRQISDAAGLVQTSAQAVNGGGAK